jgi:hypothetical protein
MPERGVKRKKDKKGIFTETATIVPTIQNLGDIRSRLGRPTPGNRVS